MANISLTAAIRVPKVNTGLASNADSERRINLDYIVCPRRGLYDTYGRGPVGIDSIDTLTANGCHDPMYRIELENEVYRPQWGYYLNVPQGMEGGQVGGPSRYNLSRADTLGMYRDQFLGYDGTYKVNTPLRPQFAGNKDDAMFYADMERMERITNRVNMSDRYANLP